MRPSVRIPSSRYTAGLLTLVLIGWSAAAGAATVPAGFAETLVSDGIFSPTAMAFAPDGRIFVCEQGGRLRVIKNGALLATPFVTVTVDSAGERGLLGVAFDPNFASNNFVYVYYTATTPATHNRLSRFTAMGDVAQPGSEHVILELNNLSSATNHNGGAIHFGPDGALYVAVGENASGANSQTLGNLLGKVLRLFPDGSIPVDNPFYNTASGNNRMIWALGLRNPFTFTFQNGTGRMFINDVGQNTWEEINDGIAGSNYGWPDTEGATTDPRFRAPLFFYGHGSGPTVGCAITGGAFYNPAAVTFPAAYVGHYFFADYCTSWIRRFDPSSGAVNSFASNAGAPVDLAVGSDGALYYLSRGSGAVFRIQSTANQAPTITTHPQPTLASTGHPATFTVTASGTAPLSYQWQRNNANILGATDSSYTLASAQLSDDGAMFRCIVSNVAGSATSNAARLTVTTDQPPTGTITQPAAGTTYAGGDTISYAGTATDGEDGTLPPSAFTWRVDFHHDTHLHPFLPPISGATSGAFTIPTSGETSANVWYRIHLTVRDSAGLTHETFRDVLPRTSSVQLSTNPAGLQVRLDGQPVTAPFSFVGVEGITRTLEATSPQAVSGTTWAFVSWSDGGALAHPISTPVPDTTYTATFRMARAGLTAPAPGSTLPGSMATFTWEPGVGVAEYWLSIGTTPGGTQVYDVSQGMVLSRTVSMLPLGGGPLYVRLWSRLGGGWEFADYTFTQGAASIAQMTAPTPGTVLASTTASFSWTAGSGATQYWLSIGTTAGGAQVYDATQGLAMSRTVSGLPSDGRTLYVRLWTAVGSMWLFNDYTYTATTAAPALITSPMPGSVLPGSSATFAWSAGTGVSSYWLSIGTAAGGTNVYDAAQGTALSRTVGGLPSNGSTVYVRIWSLIGSMWAFRDSTFTAASPALAQMTSPAPGSTLAASTTFTWTTGSGVAAYWLTIGTTHAGSQVYDAAQGTATSVTLSNIPGTGGTIYVRLWSNVTGSGWLFNDYTYTAPAASVATMTTPPPGTTLSASAVTFTWSPGSGALEFWLSVGTTPGGTQIYDASQGLGTSRAVAGIPTSGSTLYVRLWTRLPGAGWQLRDYTYTAGH